MIAWSPQAVGVWKAIVGEPVGPTPLAVVGASPRLDALQALGDPAFPLPCEAIIAESVGQRHVVRLPLAEEERLFGLGLQFMKLNQRGRPRYLRVNSDPRQDTGETHAPVPFCVSERGWGVLADTAAIVTIHLGSCARRRDDAPPPQDRNADRDWQATPVAHEMEIAVTAPGVELLLFAGATPLEVVRRYNLYCGGGALPPRWGLGFWHRVPTSYTAREVLQEAEEFRARDFPCDVIGLEPGWHSKSYPCTYVWDPERFPNPDAFLAAMGERGFRANLWEHPYVSPDAPIYADLAPLSGSHTVWGGLAPDFTLPEARAIVTAQHGKEHLDRGVSGYKIDECDGSELTGSSWMFPGHATFPSGLDGEQMRQLYGLLLQAMALGMFRERDRRTYGLVRASLAGASSLPFALYSDLYDHRQFVRALCNAGFSGLLWTPEIRSARDAEEWVRRMQTVCFSPLAMLNAWASGTKPWSYPEVEPIIRHYIQLRMRLMPYFYSAFARYHEDGTPPFRAMALEAGPEDDPRLADVDDQWMAGDSILVAPLFAGQNGREVWLPAGIWHRFEDGERFEGGRGIRVFPGLDTLPLFVREGGIVPLMPPLPRAPGPGEAVPLEVRHYGAAPGRFRLYDDDGETFAYERGELRWRTLEVTIADGLPRGTLSAVETGWRSSYGEVAWRFFG
jgi:alpha-D-xyloside xylohydrolase